MSRRAIDRLKVIPGRFYARRENRRTGSYGEHYWREAADPDGRVRDRTREREQHLDDLKHELEYVNTLPPGRVLEVGCGLGFFLSGVDDGWEKHGVEVSEFAVSRAVEWGRVVMGPLEKVGFTSGSFDVVVMHHVIEHLENPERTLAEVRRVLAPGGRLVLGAPDFDSGCARLFGSRYRLLNDPTHISLFTDESMHRFLRSQGFLIEDVDYPFFDTRHFTEDNLLRLMDADDVSPPFYGNFMTFYCRKPTGGRLSAVAQLLGDFGPHELAVMDVEAHGILDAVAGVIAAGSRLRLDAGDRSEAVTQTARKTWARLRGRSELPREIFDSAAKPTSDDTAASLVLSSVAGRSAGDVIGRSTMGCVEVSLRNGGTRGPDLGSCFTVPMPYGATFEGIQTMILGALLGELRDRLDEHTE